MYNTCTAAGAGAQLNATEVLVPPVPQSGYRV